MSVEFWTDIISQFLEKAQVSKERVKTIYREGMEQLGGEIRCFKALGSRYIQKITYLLTLALLSSSLSNYKLRKT